MVLSVSPGAPPVPVHEDQVDHVAHHPGAECDGAREQENKGEGYSVEWYVGAPVLAHDASEQCQRSAGRLARTRVMGKMAAPISPGTEFLDKPSPPNVQKLVTFIST